MRAPCVPVCARVCVSGRANVLQFGKLQITTALVVENLELVECVAGPGGSGDPRSLRERVRPKCEL